MVRKINSSAIPCLENQQYSVCVAVCCQQTLFLLSSQGNPQVLPGCRSTSISRGEEFTLPPPSPESSTHQPFFLQAIFGRLPMLKLGNIGQCNPPVLFSSCFCWAGAEPHETLSPELALQHCIHLSGLFQTCRLQHAPACNYIYLSKFSLATTESFVLSLM